MTYICALCKKQEGLIAQLRAQLRTEKHRAECVEKECAEQARLNGMGAEREANLRGWISRLKKERDQAVKSAMFYREENLRHEARLTEAEKERDGLRIQIGHERNEVRVRQGLCEVAEVRVREMEDGQLKDANAIFDLLEERERDKKRIAEMEGDIHDKNFCADALALARLQKRNGILERVREAAKNYIESDDQYKGRAGGLLSQLSDALKVAEKPT